MSIRKPRVLFHGCSNMHLLNDHSESYKTLSNHSQILHPFKKTERGKQNKKQISLQKITRIPKWMGTNEQTKKQIDPKKERILERIKNQYRSKINVKKILRGWNIETQGYLTAEEFQQKLNQNFGLNIPLPECLQFIRQFSSDQKPHLNIKDFLGMIYYSPQNVLINHKLCDFSEENKIRQIKIKDLIDKLEFYSNQNQEKLQIEQGNFSVNEVIQEAKKDSRNQLSKEFFFEMKRTSRLAGSCFSSGHKSGFGFFSRTNLSTFVPKTNRLKSYQKRLMFSPLNTLKQDQKKTRFNGILQKSDFSLGLEKDYSPKIKASQVLLQQKKQSDRKYQIKLEKIRNYRKRQQEAIEKLEEKKEAIDKANLMKRKLDQDAYNYATFIQNKWE